MPVDRLKRWGLRVLALAGSAAGLFFAVRGVSFVDLSRALRSANLAALSGWTAPLLCLALALRAARFRAVLGETPVPFPSVVASLLLSQAANNVLPLHAGELVVTRDFVAAGHPLRRVLVAQGTGKLVEGITLVLVCAPALASSFALVGPLLALAGTALVAFPLLWWLARRLRLGLADVTRALSWSAAADAVEVALVMATLNSLGLPAGLRTSVSLLGLINLAILVPSMPGHVGAFEAGAALGLVALGAPRDAALAFALLYRVVQWVPITLAGAVLWAYRTIARRVRAT